MYRSACLFIAVSVLLVYLVSFARRGPLTSRHQIGIEDNRASVASHQLSIEDNVALYQRYSVATRERVVHDVFNGLDNLRPWEGLKGGYYLWDFFPPMFNCPLRERFGKFSEGGKVLCNFAAVATDKNCVVFSFGVRDDISFEVDLMKRSHCKIFAFDPSVQSLPDGSQSMKSCNGQSAIHFNSVGIGAVSTTSIDEKTQFKLSNLADLMSQVNVEKIDLLKMDIEGGEWEVFRQLSSSGILRNVDQLSIELHFKQSKTNNAGKNSGIHEVFDFFAAVEKSGLLAFSSEVNHNPSGFFESKPYCIEYTFVRPHSRYMTSEPMLSVEQACRGKQS